MSTGKRPAIRDQRDHGHAVVEDVAQPISMFAADLALERLADAHRVVTAGSAARVELYDRRALTIRAMRRANGSSVLTRIGRDHGVAVRTCSDRERGVGFAVAPGSDVEAVTWAMRQAEASGPSLTDLASWSDEPRERAVDRDEGQLPTAARVADWLRAAWTAMTPSEPTPARGLLPSEASVEVTRTVESWVTASGSRASRVRTRAWAVAILSDAGAGVTARPVMTARRRWSDLDPSSLSAVVADRWRSEQTSSSPPIGRTSVLFNPECSASLVKALVAALFTGETEALSAVGRAWNVIHEPRDGEALFGALFDDTGFPTEATVLADGVQSRGRISGRGHHVRPSFRDRPCLRPMNLVVRAQSETPPTRGVLVSGVTLHALDPARWILEIDGAELLDGLPGARIVGATLHASPAELVERCVAAVGPARDSHLGVRTRALLFDDLELVR